jgi:hypothetical protein
MRRKNQTATWVFYLGDAKDRYRYKVVGIQVCKSPQRTKLWKDNAETVYNDENYIGHGATTDLNDPWLVWPQSEYPQQKPVLADFGDIQYAYGEK